MENLPGNSKNVTGQTPPSNAKVVEKVISGDVIRNKPSRSRRFKETFFSGEDPKEIAMNVVIETVIPGLKHMILDSAIQGAERYFFGQSGGFSRSSSSRPSSVGHIAYSQISSGIRQVRNDAKSISSAARANHNFDEIIFPIKAEADIALERMFEILSQYNVVTVADFYNLVGITGEYTDNKFGWTELRGSRVERVRKGYVISLPRTEEIK